MKIVFLLSLLTSSAWAALSIWNPISFGFDAQIVDRAIDQLEQSDDPAFRALVERDPKARTALRESFGLAFNKGFNRFYVPSILSCEPWLSDCAWATFWRIFTPGRDPSIGFDREGEAQADLVPDAYEFATTPFKYRFCEAYPDDAFCKRYMHEAQMYAGRVAVRRMISSPQFAREACESLVHVVSFHANWTKRLSTWTRVDPLERFSESIDEVIGYVSMLEDDPWSSEHYLDNLTTWQKFFFRRYMDGGPELMSSYKACANRLKTVIADANVPPISADPESTTVIQMLLNFQEIPLRSNPQKKVAVQQIRFTAESLARLHRLIPIALPTGDLLTFNRERDVSLETAISIGYWLSVIDPQYNYRLITDDEYENTIPNRKVCTANKDYLDFGLDNLELVFQRGDNPKQCTYWSLILVRQLK